MLPLNTNIRLAYANGKDDEQNFIQNLSLFLCTFLKEHGQLIEKRLNLRETLMEVRKTLWCSHSHRLRWRTLHRHEACLMLIVRFSGPPLHATGVWGGRDGDLQNLSRVLEPPCCWTLQRESLLYIHISFTLWQPALWCSTSQTALSSCAFQGASHSQLHAPLTNESKLSGLFT